MLNPVVSCSVYAVDMIIIYLFFSRIAEKKISTLKCLLFGLILFEVGSALNLTFQNNLLINTLVSITTRIVFGFYCFDIRPFQAVCYSITLVVINFALELVSVLVISTLTNTEPVDYNTNLALLIVECSTCKILLFLTCLILSHVVVPNARWSKHQLSLLFFPVSASICLAIFWFICLQDSIPPAITYLLAISSIVIFSSTVLLFMTYQHQIEMDSERIRMKSENDRLQTEKSYYKILDQQNQQLMIYAHDAKNHLAAIKNLNTDPQIGSYISKLSEQLAEYTHNCHSGNKLLDVMIHKYSVDCEIRGICFDYDVKLCNLSEVEDIDLVAILGNLIDNAISAAENSEQKRVSLATARRNSYSIIVITNSCDTPPKSNGNHLITSKADQKIHGFGLKSVGKTLKKYQGDFEWEYDDNFHEFTVTVMVGDPNKSTLLRNSM